MFRDWGGLEKKEFTPGGRGPPLKKSINAKVGYPSLYYGVGAGRAP